MIKHLAALLIALALPITASAWSWQDLWLTQNQQGERAFHKGQFKQAQTQFSDTRWKAAAAYEAKDYAAAYQALKDKHSATDLYNLGNIYAQQQQFDQAITAYNAALKKQKDFPDAAFNLALLKKMQKQQQQNKQSSSKDQQKQKKKAQASSKNKQQQNKPSQSTQANNEENKQHSKATPKQSKPKQSKQKNENNAHHQSKEQNTKQAQKEAKQPQNNKQPAQTKPSSPESAKNTPPQKQHVEQAKPSFRKGTTLDQVEDNPGSLLKQKLWRDYQRRQQQGKS
jgi:Ca-activated chloride channel family protein